MTRKSQTQCHLSGDQSGGLRWPFVLVTILASFFSANIVAQDVSCPCFSLAEVEAIFQDGQTFAKEGGVFACEASDYSVEIEAEVTVWNQDYEVVAQARVDWYDFDPGRCVYINEASAPGGERATRWPHPAPEELARACFDIITGVIAESDNPEGCNVYP